MKTLKTVVDALGSHGAKTALVVLQKESVERLSFDDLAERATQLAGGLAKNGVQPGESVALFADTGPEAIAACLAVIAAGAVAVPVDVQLGEKTLAHVLDDSEARIIFTNSKRLERLKTVKAGRKLVLLDAKAEDDRSWEHLLSKEKVDLDEPAQDDIAVLFYTSGTTGPP